MYMFSYGSNMNPDRMTSREVKFKSFEYGILRHYKLRSNKISKNCRTQAFANIEPCYNQNVFGILYELDISNDLIVLDKKEGYPIHYEKTLVQILTNTGFKTALVYIATRSWSSRYDSPMSAEYKKLIFDGIEICEKLIPNDKQLLESFSGYKNNAVKLL